MAQATGNLLLDAYYRQVGATPLPHLQPVPLPFKAGIFHPGERPRHIHFVTSGLASLVALLSEGEEVEVAMTAHEGFPEAVYLLGPELANRNCLMQVPGTGLRLSFAEGERLFHENALLRRLVLRFMQYQHLVSMQLVACNGQHDSEQRLARWILMVQDRVKSSQLPLTQEFLGQMLGARRSTVTIAASSLQRAGMIDYSRGNIRIMDRDGLADTACECYGVIRKLYDHLYEH